MGGLRADELLQRAVRLRGIRLGRIVDVIFDPDATRVVGFDVLCGDEVHRFLPFSAVGAAAPALEVSSALMLLDTHELEFYRRYGLSLEGGNAPRDALVSVDGAVTVEGTPTGGSPSGGDTGRC
ncbi:MAG TPA: PRC-barrel domain-containing protein [Gaiellaceae bacterium]|nr:PRC-barrel domain-containing protein [Gaiellaceae bacterium]